jgi:hypothetical protein
MPKVVSEMSIVIKIASTYLSNQSKIEQLKEENANELNLEKIESLNKKNLLTITRLNAELTNFKAKLTKESRIITIAITNENQQFVRKLLKLENPKVDLKYCKLFEIPIFTYLKKVLLNGEIKTVKIEVLKSKKGF